MLILLIRRKDIAIQHKKPSHFALKKMCSISFYNISTRDQPITIEFENNVSTHFFYALFFSLNLLIYTESSKKHFFIDRFSKHSIVKTYMFLFIHLIFNKLPLSVNKFYNHLPTFTDAGRLFKIQFSNKIMNILNPILQGFNI